jgi:site-specific DNA recombinase
LRRKVITMTSHNDPAGLWLRVSTGGQDEANQEPDILRHCQDRGYAIARRYELNDKSASKGEQQATLDAMLEDMREGVIKVLVCWHSDRVERRGPEALFRLLRQIKDAGGRIESTKEPLLGTEDLSGEAVTALNAVIAHQESVQKSERQRISIAGLRAKGAVSNNLPWGYVAVGEKLNKHAEPTDLARRVIPQIFDMSIAGYSLRQIAAWLDSEGIPSPRGKDHWNESTIRWTIKNRAYAGRILDKDGQTVLRCQALVTGDTWDRANQALKTRPHRGPTKRERPMLAKLRCARCGSPMYRLRSGGGYYYYRCFGSGPQRKGCGNMVPYDAAEATVYAWVGMTNNEPHTTRIWVEGSNHDSEISEVKQDIRELTEAERFEDIPALTARLAELRSLPTVPGHYEYTETGITKGKYFTSLDSAGQREYLAEFDIRIEKAPNGIRLVVDGEDYGVIYLG